MVKRHVWTTKFHWMNLRRILVSWTPKWKILENCRGWNSPIRQVVPRISCEQFWAAGRVYFPNKKPHTKQHVHHFHQFCAASILSARNSSQSIQALVTCSMARVENNSAGREPLTSGHTWTLKSAILGPTVLVPFPVLSLHDLRLYWYRLKVQLEIQSENQLPTDDLSVLFAGLYLPQIRVARKQAAGPT